MQKTGSSLIKWKKDLVKVIKFKESTCVSGSS